MSVSYIIMCSCGDIASIKAQTRAEAELVVEHLWSPVELSKHMCEKHPTETPPSYQKLIKHYQAKLVPMF